MREGVWEIIREWGGGEKKTKQTSTKQTKKKKTLFLAIWPLHLIQAIRPN